MTSALILTGLALILWRVLILDSVVVMSTRRIHNYVGARMSEVQDAVDGYGHIWLGLLGDRSDLRCRSGPPEPQPQHPDEARAEVVAAIAELEAREPSVDLTALKAAAQSLDDLNVDPVVVEPPVEEPPVVEAPAE